VNEHMTETQYQQRITDTCDLLGVTWHHETDSRRSKAGFPDLVLVGNRVIFAELKTQRGKMSPQQRFWASALTNAEGVEYHLWRPSDWPEVYQRLFDLAKPVHTGVNSEADTLAARRVKDYQERTKGWPRPEPLTFRIAEERPTDG